MSSLLELQRDFARALLDGDAGPMLSAFIGAMDRSDRFDVYRNNVHASLSEALADMFLVVRRLVGEGFFSYVVHEFVSTHPPTSPCVADYGSGFADFLAAFAPCRDYPYLPDVARFECLLHDAARACDAAALDVADLGRVAVDAAERLAFGFHPSLGYLLSTWLVSAIWRANQADRDGVADLRAGGSLIEVCRRAATVEYRELPPGLFAFRAALAGGAALADALGVAVERDESFDATAALAELFRDRAVISFYLVE